jgi:DNA repair protein SbcC/Rad50
LLITEVKLENIKNHAQAEYKFEPGVTAICGPNGSGKTSIIEAIAWALFDHLDYNRDDFVRRGQKRGQVVISLISNADIVNTPSRATPPADIPSSMSKIKFAWSNKKKMSSVG